MFQKIGILGGGQLGRMLIQSAISLDIEVYVLDASIHAPCAAVTPNFVCGDITNFEDVMTFGEQMDIITVEIENVNIEALISLKSKGKNVYPDPDILALIKDKGTQKSYFAEHDFPSSKFRLFSNKSEIVHALNIGQIQFPFVQKLRKEGYDGRGVCIIKDTLALKQAFDTPSIVEELVDIQSELAIMIARNADGDTTIFPIVEMDFHSEANMLNYVQCPADIPNSLSEQIENLAISLVKDVDFIGIMAIELFLTHDGKIMINELAPRPHNSGHHTIEACNFSQFDMHLRSILNLPLPKVMLKKHAIMMNLVGSEGYTGSAICSGLHEVMTSPDAHVHWYGKKETKPMRKMGHITFTGTNHFETMHTYLRLKDQIQIVSQ
ncbi:MAG: 5-(carboxyamino)imidazole ribonucleotide synthase [Saprospiraceae bacterium]